MHLAAAAICWACQPPLVCVALYHFLFHLSRVFRVQRPSQKFKLYQTKWPTCFLGQSGLTPVLWPRFQFLITYLLAQSLISFGPDLISLQLRLICMAVNTGLTKLTNCDKSKVTWDHWKLKNLPSVSEPDSESRLSLGGCQHAAAKEMLFWLIWLGQQG